MQLKVKRPSISLSALRGVKVNEQTRLLTFGLVIPTILLWAAHWLVFGLSAKLATIEAFLTSNADQIAAVLPDFQLSGFYSDVLFKLNANQGLAFVVVGIVVFAFASFLSLWMFRAFDAEELALGQIRLQSVVISAVVGLVIAAVLVAILNQVFVFSFPTELIQIFWA